MDLAGTGRMGEAYAMRGPGQEIFHDGAGLCLQGNRRPAFRKISEVSKLGERFLNLTSEEELRKDLYRLALGKCDAPPFRKEVVEEARRSWLEYLAEGTGASLDDLKTVEPRQPFMLAALGAHLSVRGQGEMEKV